MLFCGQLVRLEKFGSRWFQRIGWERLSWVRDFSPEHRESSRVDQVPRTSIWRTLCQQVRVHCEQMAGVTTTHGFQGNSTHSTTNAYRVPGQPRDEEWPSNRSWKKRPVRTKQLNMATLATRQLGFMQIHVNWHLVGRNSRSM